jgi:hypothetical protein
VVFRGPHGPHPTRARSASDADASIVGSWQEAPREGASASPSYLVHGSLTGSPPIIITGEASEHRFAMLSQLEASPVMMIGERAKNRLPCDGWLVILQGGATPPLRSRRIGWCVHALTRSFVSWGSRIDESDRAQAPKRLAATLVSRDADALQDEVEDAHRDLPDTNDHLVGGELPDLLGCHGLLGRVLAKRPLEHKT